MEEKPSIHQWPSIQIPNISLVRIIGEKFVSFSNQIFLVDHKNQNNFYYRHVFLDILRTVQIYKSNGISSNSTIGVISGDQDDGGCYETVINLLAVIFLDAKLVLLDGRLNKAQLSTAIKRCRITNLIVTKNQTKIIDRYERKCPNRFTVSFGEPESRSARNHYQITEILPENLNLFGSREIIRKRNDPNRIRILIPQFQGQNLERILTIREFDLISQLTFAMLPRCGFEWNINEIILAANRLCTVIGVLELLATIMTGARLIINHRIDSMVDVIERNKISACILDSSYLIEMLEYNDNDEKRIGSLKKIIYIRQPLHRSVAYAFRTKFKIFNCRFAFYLPEATGFAAIEIANYDNGTMVVPMPMMNIQIIDLNGNNSNETTGELGKIYLQSPYMYRKNGNDENQWIDSGYLGYHDSTGNIQIIDHYNNFIEYKKKLISKSLVKIILMSHDSIRRCEFSSMISNSEKRLLKILVEPDKSFLQGQPDVDDLKKELQNFLEERLNGIEWEFEILTDQSHPSLPLRKEFFDSENILPPPQFNN